MEIDIIYFSIECGCGKSTSLTIHVVGLAQHTFPMWKDTQNASSSERVKKINEIFK